MKRSSFLAMSIALALIACGDQKPDSPLAPRLTQIAGGPIVYERDSLRLEVWSSSAGVQSRLYIHSEMVLEGSSADVNHGTFHASTRRGDFDVDVENGQGRLRHAGGAGLAARRGVHGLDDDETLACCQQEAKTLVMMAASLQVLQWAVIGACVTEIAGPLGCAAAVGALAIAEALYIDQVLALKDCYDAHMNDPGGCHF